MSDNSNGRDTTMHLAQTCSTCKWALFKRRSYDYYYQGKKQLGMCLVWCDGEVPEVPGEPQPSVAIAWDKAPTWKKSNLSDAARAGYLCELDEYLRLGREQYETWIRERHSSLTVGALEAGERWDHGMAQVRKYQAEGTRFSSWVEKISREAYVEEAHAQAAQFRAQWDSGELMAKHMAELAVYYPLWRANYDWWQENWPKCRRCHRNTGCDAWENAGGRHEPYARAIAGGNGIGAYALENKKEA